MEEDHEQQKHVCKLCDKRFPCGRSLGGHMRSHVIIMNNTNNNHHNSDETLKKKNKKKKKLSSVNNNGGFNNNNKNTIGDTSFEGGYQIGYGLRENPKKTFRFEEEEEDDGNLVNDKICKECGKGFQSWKALFGHMKCHSDKVHKNNNTFLEGQSSSWTNNGNQKKLVIDSQSDNDTSAPSRLNRRRSSRRRRTRYMAAASASATTAAAAAATTSSSLSLANYASSSVTEIEQEQEEVALCLMMLSRDVGHWVGLNSAAESSDNDSVFLEAPPPPPPPSLRINQVMDKSTSTPICDDSLRIGPMMKRMEVPLNVFPSNDNCKFEVSEVELGKSMIKLVGDQPPPLGSNKYNLSKKRLCGEADLVLNSSKKTVFDASDSELLKSSYKRSKFECTTCNKTFHSYQALGGHRASHKKIKGCSASKIILESCENSIETELFSPSEQTTVVETTKLMIKSYNSGKNPIEVAPAAKYAENPEAAKKAASKKSIISSSSSTSIKGHECPICFRVFSSGQALGGHKRSHLVNNNSSEAKTDHYHHHHHHQPIIIQKPNHHDFLDLNLPAPVEEESTTNNNGHVGVKPWWVGSSHKREALFGLISN